MRGVRNTGFVVSLALLASLVGHFAIQRHFERRSKARLELSPAEFSLTSDSNLIPPVDMRDLAAFSLPRFLEHDRNLGDIIPAADSQEDASHSRSPKVNNPPTAVPAPTDAVPVETSHDEETFARDIDTSAVRDVIEHELSHATREEREIWFEELKSLPAGVVSDLLQVRKQLHALPKLLGGMPEKLASADPNVFSRTQEVNAEPASQKIRFNLPDHNPAAAALEAAMSQMRHNLANAATPGFKRLRVTLVDSYGSTWHEGSAADDRDSDGVIGTNIQGEGCRMAPLVLDLKQGSLKKTARQLDLAIDGDGFFVVHRGDKEFLTRCGAFTLDRDRQLCLALSNENAVMQPVVKVPDDAREVQISAEGVVTVLKSSDTTLSVIGQLQLARVASPTRLQPAGHTLFVANEQSGALVLSAPMSHGIGELQQGFLEQSNVDFEQELAEIEELTMILKALPLTNSRPATAKSLQHSNTR